MALSFEINGAPQDLKPGWRINEVLNGRNVMDFAVESYDGTYRPAAKAPVVFDDTGTTLFAGLVVARPKESGFGGVGASSAIRNDCSAADYSLYPERRLIELSVPAGSKLKDILIIIAAVLAPYGVTLHASQANGPTFADAISLTVAPTNTHLDKLSVMTGFGWHMSYGKVLHMAAPGTQADGTAWNAPFNISADSTYVTSDIEVMPSMTAFGNHVTVKYSTVATTGYAFFEMTANRVSPEPGTPETVVCGGKTYTFRDDVVANNSDGNVKIGGTLLDSLVNLHRAITLSGTAGVEYAEAMTVNSSVTAGMQNDTTLKVVSIAPGLAGNTPVSDTCDNASWRTEGGEVVTTLKFGADSDLKRYVTATNSPTAADREDLLFEHPEIQDEATAQYMADGYLARAQAATDEIHYTVNTGGLHPGMKQTIVEPKRNLNSSTCLIVSVTIRAKGEIFSYDIVAVEQLIIPPSHLEFWHQSSSGSGGGGSISAFLSGTGGTGGGGSTKIRFPLGGSRSNSQEVGTTRTPVLDWQPFEAPAAMSATVRATCLTIIAGHEVTPLLAKYNTGTEEWDAVSPTGAPTTSTTGEEQTFVVALVSGGLYRLEHVTDNAAGEACTIGQLQGVA